MACYGDDGLKLESVDVVDILTFLLIVIDLDDLILHHLHVRADTEETVVFLACLILRLAEGDRLDLRMVDSVFTHELPLLRVVHVE